MGPSTKSTQRERAEEAKSFINRELSWLSFARRVLALVEDCDTPLLERLNFAGIAGMLHDEFFMKRMSGLQRQVARNSSKIGMGGLTPQQEYDACREELSNQGNRLGSVLQNDLRPALAKAGIPLLDHDQLDPQQKRDVREYFQKSVLPILIPLAVDSEHPFPFVSNLGLNLAILFRGTGQSRRRFVRMKVPDNRPRWVPLPDGAGFVPLEQLITANLDLIYPDTPPTAIHYFRVTRGAAGDPGKDDPDEDIDDRPGGIIDQVSRELKARRFAGVVRLQVNEAMPGKLRKWLLKQLGLGAGDLYPSDALLGLNDLSRFDSPEHHDLRFSQHDAATHPRLVGLASKGGIFEEIARGDLLLHHPYHSFDSSVLTFLESAAVDPDVLAIKLTIYRTNSGSPIVKALAEAARRGKQVAVVVEVTARFDEAPNIAWGRYLENEGVHVAYGVEDLKTHVKLGLVVREEEGVLRQYAHIGTGNYHTGTAKLYEDLGMLTCDSEICEDVAEVFNALTGATPYRMQSRLLIAPVSMRDGFTKRIRREIEHAKAGRPCGIEAKMNQLQDSDIIRELYSASQARVPVTLNVRGLCCLRPGVKGLSENIKVFGVVGRFLEHSRIYKFVNGGSPEFFFGSADWMKRNLNNRVETLVPVLDKRLQTELDLILKTYYTDNCTVWDCRNDGVYVRRTPVTGEKPRSAQTTFVRNTEDLPDSWDDTYPSPDLT